MCTVLLPPGYNPIAINIYIISYHINKYFAQKVKWVYLNSAQIMGAK